MKALLLLSLCYFAYVTAQTCNTPPTWNNNPTTQSGTSSWFDAVAQGGGACGYTPNTNDRYVAAYSSPTVAEMCEQCGNCFNVTGPQGSVVVRIIDYCDVSQGTCNAGSFTLDKVPYTVIAGSTSTGSVSITYFPVACPYTIPLQYTWGPSGNQPYYVAIRVDWERYPLTSVEIMTGGTTGPYTSLPRQPDNVWSYNPSTAQVMPANVRVNDSTGVSIVDVLQSFSISCYNSNNNFPYVTGTTTTGTSGTGGVCPNGSSSPASIPALPPFLALLFCLVLIFLLM